MRPHSRGTPPSAAAAVAASLPPPPPQQQQQQQLAPLVPLAGAAAPGVAAPSTAVAGRAAGSRPGKSGFRGVSWHAKSQSYQAYYDVPGEKRITLPYFKNAEDAARARDNAILERNLPPDVFQKMRLNFPEEAKAAASASSSLPPLEPWTPQLCQALLDAFVRPGFKSEAFAKAHGLKNVKQVKFR